MEDIAYIQYLKLCIKDIKTTFALFQQKIKFIIPKQIANTEKYTARESVETERTGNFNTRDKALHLHI